MVVHQTPLSVGFHRQQYWSGLSPHPEDLPNPGIEPMSSASPALQADSLWRSHWGSQLYNCCCCCCCVASVVSDSVRPQKRQPTRLPRPWDSPGKNTGVGCHFLLQCMKVKSESEVAQSCLTPSDPMDCSPPGTSVHGTFQARVLEWGAIAFAHSHSKWTFPKALVAGGTRVGHEEVLPPCGNFL